MTPFRPPTRNRSARLAIGVALTPLLAALVVALAHRRDAVAHPIVPTGPVEARDVAPLQQGAELRRIAATMLHR